MGDTDENGHRPRCSELGQPLVARVKWFSREKGFGFLTDADGNDVFVHHNVIDMAAEPRFLVENEFVEYLVSTRTDGPRVGQLYATYVVRRFQYVNGKRVVDGPAEAQHAQQ